jgi:serine/threonine protein kinase
MDTIIIPGRFLSGLPDQTSGTSEAGINELLNLLQMESNCQLTALKILEFVRDHQSSGSNLLFLPENMEWDGENLLLHPINLTDAPLDTPEACLPPETFIPGPNTSSGSMWSLGTFIYECLTGDLLPIEFDDQTGRLWGLEDIFDVQFGSAAVISGPAKDLMRILLQEDPNKRPTPTAALEFRWFRAAQATLKRGLRDSRSVRKPVGQPVDRFCPREVCAQ